MVHDSIKLQFGGIRRIVHSRLVDYICYRIIGPKGPLYSAREQPDDDEDDEAGDSYTEGINSRYSMSQFVEFLRVKFKVKKGKTKEVCIPSHFPNPLFCRLLTIFLTLSLEMMN